MVCSVSRRTTFSVVFFNKSGTALGFDLHETHFSEFFPKILFLMCLVPPLKIIWQVECCGEKILVRFSISY